MPIPDPKSDNLTALEGIIPVPFYLFIDTKKEGCPSKYHAGVVSAQPTVLI